MESIVFGLEGVHCPSCVSSITSLLLQEPLSFSPEDFIVQLLPPSLILYNNARGKINIFLLSEILSQSGYYLLGEEHALQGPSNNTHVVPLGAKNNNAIPDSRFSMRRWKAHLASCSACRAALDKEQTEKRLWAHDLSSKASLEKEKQTVVSVPDDRDMEVEDLVVVLELGGLTCAACTNSIKDGLEAIKGVSRVQVTLLPSQAIVNGTMDPENLTQVVEDLGYFVVNVSSTKPNSRTLVSRFTIEGMTCSACIETLSGQLSGLKGVQKVQVTLLPPHAKVEHEHQLSSDDLKREIENVGYGAELILESQADISERTLKIRVSGMFCDNCANAINVVLNTLEQGGDIESFTPVSFKNPCSTIVYTPSPPDGFTIRSLIEKIEAIGPFTVHPLSNTTSVIQSTSKALKREMRNILFRVGITGLFVVPTFVLAVVVHLLPAHNSTRVLFERRVWGNNTLSTMILFALATPVQFGIGGYFMSRAWNGLAGVWKRKNWYDRIFRWGSMDSLVSIGTLVAWTTSFIFMILDGTRWSNRHAAHGTEQAMPPMAHFDMSVFLIFFILIGRVLDSWGKHQTMRLLDKLGQKKIKTAILLSQDNLGQQSEEVDVKLVEKNDTLLVRSGSGVPVDCELTESSSSSFFDESSLTGETKPVFKQPGDKIWIGTQNLGPSAVIVRVIQHEGDSIMDGIAKAVRDGIARKAEIEKFATILTGYFVPFVCGVACLTFVAWIIRGYSGGAPREWLTDEGFEDGGWALWAVQFSVAVLVVACPCGIGLAAPTAQMIGTGIAAKYGIVLYGGSEGFQNARNVDAVVLDKTGTITTGNFKVTDHWEIPLEDKMTRREFWALIATIEEHSSHPLSIGIRDFCQTTMEAELLSEEDPRNTIVVKDVRELPGQGLEAAVEIKGEIVVVLVGNQRLMDRYNVGASIEDSINERNEWRKSGKTVVMIGLQVTSDLRLFKLGGALALQDPPREESKTVVERFNKQGILVFMSTGDDAGTAANVANQVGIPSNRVFAGVLPLGKKTHVEQIQNGSYYDDILAARKQRKKWLGVFGDMFVNSSSRARVLFVGDGINDAAALSQADVSVSMGTGASIAKSSSDFCILSSNLKLLFAILTLSDRTYRKILTNFAWACVFNIVLIPLAAGAFYDVHKTRLPPVWSALAMALSSVSVVLNSLLMSSKYNY